MSKEQTEKRVEKALQVAHILLDAIKEAGNEGIPSGHLYAACMQFMSLDMFQAYISMLKRAGRVTEQNYILKAV